MLLRLRDLDLTKKPGLSELLDWVGYLQMIQAPRPTSRTTFPISAHC